MRPEEREEVLAILQSLVDACGLRAALLLDREGDCLASRGDGEAMAAVATTHLAHGIALGHLCRDADGSTILSAESAESVRLESVAGRFILTLVCTDPVMSRGLRKSLDTAKARLDRLLRASD